MSVSKDRSDFNRQIMPIRLVEEITRRRKRYKKIYFYTGTDRCDCYLAVDVYPTTFSNVKHKLQIRNHIQYSYL